MEIIVGIGGFALMIVGIGVAIWQMFADRDSGTAMIGLVLGYVGADFTLLYLVHVGYLEWGIPTYTLLGCFSLIVFLTLVRGIVCHRL